MCGIAGLVNLDARPASPDIVRAMASAVAHRGPDDEGVLCHGPVGLGHRRLAILDPTSAGHQPMETPDGRYAITYNGEIYNFRELRERLASGGREFRTRCDTEVLLHAYAEWGADCVAELNGMFAFAVYDRQRRLVFCARDRYGIKPLYYARIGRSVLFGSEVKALLAHPECTARLDPEALLEYFTFQNQFRDRTLFEGVRLLPAGCTLTIPLEGTGGGRTRYWDYAFREPDGVRPSECYIDELDELFRQAVRRQVVSDVGLGCYLSGGMDSGSITAIAAESVPSLRTFTVGFDLHSISGLEVAFDERAAAEHMSYLVGSEQYEMVLKSGDMERAMADLTWHLEDPRVGQSYPNFYAAKLAGSFEKVVLAGTGGDELFGGYPWRYFRGSENESFEAFIDAYYLFWHRLVPNCVIHRLFAPIWDEVKHVWTRDIFRDVFTAHAPELRRREDYLNHSLYFEAKTFLHGLLLVEDKLSMSHGLETRVPFLDNDLVDYAQQVPVSLKLGNLEDPLVRVDENEPGPKVERYFLKTRDGKLVLRDMLRRHVPSEVADRVKQGFSAPDASWFRGESIDYVKRRVLAQDARINDYLDATVVRELVGAHLEGRENHRLFIWALLSVEEWLRTFLDGSTA